MVQCAMKILLLNYEFPPIGGGAGMATYCLSEVLANFGNDVDVLTSGSLGDKPVEKIKGTIVYRAISLHNLLKPVTKMIWRRSKAVVAVTNSLRKMALKTAPGQPIDVITNGVDTDLFKQLNASPIDRFSFNLICVSRLIERKGIEDILSAMAGLQMKDIKLSIVGSGNYERRLKQRCHELSLNSVVEFKGFCPREDLPILYAQSDAFILTPRSEAFGNVFAEAMSCGLPVIGTDVRGIPDLLTEPNGLLVKPGDIDAIKSAILRLKHSRRLCTQMGKAGREKIARNYQWPYIAKKFLHLYAS